MNQLDQDVLVIGGGSSGIDIVAHLGKTASNVTFSQHKVANETVEEREKREKILPSNTKLQDDVKRFTPNGVQFIDDSHQTFDVVMLYLIYWFFIFPLLKIMLLLG